MTQAIDPNLVVSDSACVPQVDKEVKSPENDALSRYAKMVTVAPVSWLSEVSSDLDRGILTPLPVRTQKTKRLIDVIGSLVGIILLAPIMLLTCIAVKISSPGNAIFCQQRVGLNRRTKRRTDRRSTSNHLNHTDRRQTTDRRTNQGYGRPFTLYKFRTMVVDAEKNGAQFAQKNDPRITPLGRFMRRTRLDELPQLWNVLRGDMSLVGPRPERPEFIEELTAEVPNYLDRLQLKPGVTGVAQIVNGYDNNIDSFKRKVAYDLLYLRNCCLWNDLKILTRTIFVVLTGKGAL